MDRIDFDRIADRLRNWGRWGADDQRGTLNHITPAALHAAAGTVRTGKAFSLSIAFDQAGPQVGGIMGRFNPLHFVTALGRVLNPDHPSARASDDVVTMPLQCATQWDALGHVHYDGTLYNGHAAAETLSERGAARLGIEHLATPGIMGRGILIDVARLHRCDVLPADYAISIDDLDACCAAAGITPRAGDVALIRTGHIRHLTVHHDVRAFNSHHAGLHHRCAEWLHRHCLAAVAADNIAVEVVGPDLLRGEMPSPLHMLCLRDMGMPLGEMFDLEALAADCAADGRYQFLLSAPPLPVTFGFGSPVNPIALK